MPPGSLAMLIVSAFLVWEERVSDEELISIVNDIEEFLGLQCPPNDILELVGPFSQCLDLIAPIDLSYVVYSQI